MSIFVTEVQTFFLSKFATIYALPRSCQTLRYVHLYKLNPTRISTPGAEQGPQEQLTATYDRTRREQESREDREAI